MVEQAIQVFFAYFYNAPNLTYQINIIGEFIIMVTAEVSATVGITAVLKSNKAK